MDIFLDDDDDDEDDDDEQGGITVVDIYSEWSGPCTAMQTALKKIKLEVNQLDHHDHHDHDDHDESDNDNHDHDDNRDDYDDDEAGDGESVTKEKDGTFVDDDEDFQSPKQRQR